MFLLYYQFSFVWYAPNESFVLDPTKWTTQVEIAQIMVSSFLELNFQRWAKLCWLKVSGFVFAANLITNHFDVVVNVLSLASGPLNLWLNKN